MRSVHLWIFLDGDENQSIFWLRDACAGVWREFSAVPLVLVSALYELNISGAEYRVVIVRNCPVTSPKLELERLDSLPPLHNALNLGFLNFLSPIQYLLERQWEWKRGQARKQEPVPRSLRRLQAFYYLLGKSKMVYWVSSLYCKSLHT
jgi:hypothetical protein